jgi:hypothetical protein
LAWGAVCVLEVAVRVSHGCDQIFLPVMGGKGVEMTIRPITYGASNWLAPIHRSNIKLFDANGEVRVGDVVHFNKKPCFVERIGELVTIVMMDERKYTLNVLPHQIDCVLQKGESK